MLNFEIKIAKNWRRFMIMYAVRDCRYLKIGNSKIGSELLCNVNQKSLLLFQSFDILKNIFLLPSRQC
jgi:hypothetical protein